MKINPFINAANEIMGLSLLRQSGFYHNLFSPGSFGPFKKCGNCKSQNVSFEHIKECFKNV